MKIIPVIDLKQGFVARAAGGDRRHYLPWRSPLCPDAEPLQAVSGFLAFHAFPAIYIADLDAIEGGARQDGVIAGIVARHPALEIWVDNGLAGQSEISDWQRDIPARLVIGSESMGAAAPFTPPDCVLSLDFKAGEFVGPEALLADAEAWPRDVVVMSLDHVGGGGGPDVDLLAPIRARAPGATRLFAAGGVRGMADLASLARLGVNGALIATALHDGALGAAELAALTAYGEG